MIDRHCITVQVELRLQAKCLPDRCAYEHHCNKVTADSIPLLLHEGYNAEAVLEHAGLRAMGKTLKKWTGLTWAHFMAECRSPEVQQS